MYNMRTIWSLLIDISSSMDEPFSGEKAPKGLIEIGGWTRKIEAAKELLLRQARNLPSVELLIIAFNQRSNIIYQGPSDDFLIIQD